MQDSTTSIGTQARYNQIVVEPRDQVRAAPDWASEALDHMKFLGHQI